MLDFGIGVQTYLNFITHTLAFYMNNCWGFKSKVSFKVCEHVAKIE